VIKKNQTRLILFLNNHRGYQTFLHLKKKNKYKIIKIILSKRFLNKKIYQKLKKYSPLIISNPNTKKIISLIKFNRVDFNLVCGFPYIFEKKTISGPKYCTLNLHGGRLPQYRGGSPLNWQIINGEKYIGISIIKMSHNIDTGPILIKNKFILRKNFDIAKVHQIANKLFPKMVEKAMNKIVKNPKLKLNKQNESKSNYFKQRKEKDGKINWKQSALRINNLIRAVTDPYPGAFAYDSKKKKIRILKSIIADKNNEKSHPGKVSRFNNNTYVDCYNGKIKILKSSRRLISNEILT